MLDISQFRQFVVRPALKALEPWIPYSEDAVDLLMGTAIQESMLTALKQYGGGPARGLYQIEPATHDDVYKHYLGFNEEFEKAVLSFAVRGANLHDELVTNLIYATVIARIKYYRDSKPLPDGSDVEAMGAYYKRVFNTAGGKGTAEEFIDKYRKYVLKH